MASLIIPWQSLSEEALEGIIEEFVTREGTEYGEHEVNLADKCSEVRRQLEKGEAEITWDEEKMSCSLVLKDCN